MNTINLLVIEDEKSICLEYKRKCNDISYINLVGTTGSSTEALEMCKKYHPNVIILDLELHNGSGNGLSFLKELQSVTLSACPFILVVTNNTSTITHQTARKYGADFVIVKTQQDYSVQMVLNTISVFDDAGLALDSKHDEQEDIVIQEALNYRRKLRDEITKELDLIGISPRAKGRKYLRDAIEITCDKETPNLCMEIAKQYSKTSASVERAMQNAIDRAWSITDPETLEEQYTAYINPRKGVPTLMQFIYYYAEKVKKNI